MTLRQDTNTTALRTRRQLAALVVAALIGIAIGVATSFAQNGFSGTWQALSNSASPWLLGAFVAGVLIADRTAAMVGGLGACVLEVVGYYVTTSSRGFAVSTTEIVFWVVCAIIGGPVFGWAGWAWRRADADLRAIGGAFLPATFLAEAIGTYQLRLHYVGDVMLYVAIGVVLLVALMTTVHRVVRPLLATIVLTGLGIVVYWLVLGGIGGAAFGAA